MEKKKVSERREPFGTQKERKEWNDRSITNTARMQREENKNDLRTLR
jgi:hypothetical protein